MQIIFIIFIVLDIQTCIVISSSSSSAIAKLSTSSITTTFFSGSAGLSSTAHPFTFSLGSCAECVFGSSSGGCSYCSSSSLALFRSLRV